jgi:uncharacterized protein YegL
MAKSKKKTDQKTLVTMLLDRSYSMMSLKEDTLLAINGYLETLRGSKSDVHFSLVLFDSSMDGKMHLEKVVVGKPVSEVADLTSKDFEPRGGTPLIDAACMTIRAVEESLEGKKAKSVFVIQTDGDENTSQECKWSDLKSLIERKEKDGWEFTFMGAGIDAYKQGSMMGISKAKTIAYGTDRNQTRAAFAATASNIAAFAEGSVADIGYTADQKFSSGDVS